MVRQFAAVALAAGSVLCPGWLLAAEYTPVNLGTLGGVNNAEAVAINASGKVVGTASIPAGNIHAVLFSGIGSGNTDLGGGGISSALSINTSGQIVGRGDNASGVPRATLFSGTGTGNTELGTLDDAANSQSTATSINTAGQVVGYASGPGGGNRAVLYRAIGNLDLGTLGSAGQSVAYDINSGGVVVGESVSASTAGYPHATLFSGTGSNNTDLGTLGGSSSSAQAINDGGQIVGYAINTDGNTRAVLFGATPAENSDLGTLGGARSEAKDINNKGQIVGRAQAAGSSQYYGFLLSTGSGMVNVNSLIEPNQGWFIEECRAINDSGWIAAAGLRYGVKAAILLIPSGSSTPTPTPSATPAIPAAPGGSITGKKKLTVEKPKIKLKGATSGDVTGVSYRVGTKGSFKPAKFGGSAWQLTAKLKPGKNVVFVVFHGPGGESSPVKVTVTRK